MAVYALNGSCFVQGRKLWPTQKFKNLIDFQKFSLNSNVIFIDRLDET